MDEQRIAKLRTRFAPGILNALITAAGNDARLAYVEKGVQDIIKRETDVAAQKAAECGKPTLDTIGDDAPVPCNLKKDHEGDCDHEYRGGLLMPEPIDPNTLVTVSAYDVDKITDLALDYADTLARKATSFDADRAERLKKIEIANAVAAARALDAQGAGRVKIEEVNGGRQPIDLPIERPNPAPSLS